MARTKKSLVKEATTGDEKTVAKEVPESPESLEKDHTWQYREAVRRRNAAFAKLLQLTSDKDILDTVNEIQKQAGVQGFFMGLGEEDENADGTPIDVEPVVKSYFKLVEWETFMPKTEVKAVTAENYPFTNNKVILSNVLIIIREIIKI